MSDKHEEYIKRLDKIESDLSWIIQYLLKKEQLFSPPLQIYKTYCNKCGMTFEDVTGYWCPQANCPIFTKTTL